MHENVDIAKDLQQTKTIFESLLLTQGGGTQGTSGGGDSTLHAIADDILSKVLCVQMTSIFLLTKQKFLN